MQHSSVTVEHSFINILTGSDLSQRKLPVVKMDTGIPGPVLWLTACIHGDEVGGIITIQEVIRYLKAHGILAGCVYAFPLMNPMGFESMSRKIPLTGEDLNRSFPGDRNGTLAQRIAYKIFSTIVETNPTLVVDLHNDWIKSIPYTVVDHFPGLPFREAYQKSRFYSKKTGFIIIDEQDDVNKEDLKKSLSGSLLRRNIPALTLELGEAYVVNEGMVKDGLDCILNILQELKMIPQQKQRYVYPVAKPFRRILHYTQKPSSGSSGIVRFLVNPGDIVEKGQPVARIFNVFGDLLEELTALHHSIVLGHADSSVSVPGRELLAFAYVPEEQQTLG